jgi:hypothetical protein
MVPAPAGDDACRFLAEPTGNLSGIGLTGKKVTTTMVDERPSERDRGGTAAFSIQDVARRANVPEAFVRHLVTVGALPSQEAGLGPREVWRARLLQAWEAAGLGRGHRHIGESRGSFA